jgi:putative tricarboxylic transport membrane protein
LSGFKENNIIIREAVKMKKRSLVIIGLTLSIVMLLSLVSCKSTAPNGEPAGEQGQLDYPKRTIEMLVPFGAGGSSDIMARVLAPIMEDYIDVSVNVVNKAGGGSLDGTLYVHSQPADGYTLLQVTPSHPIIESKGDAPINFTEEFVPIGCFQVDIMSLAVLKDNPNFQTFDEMIAYAKENPGKVKIGGTSPGGLDDFLVNALGDAAGVEFTFVPYNSGGERNAAFLGGEIDVYMDKLIAFLQMLQSEDVVPIATLYDRRLSEVPEMADVPCTVEKGVNFTQGSWRGYAVKKGTPQPIIDFLEELLKKAYDSEKYRKQAELDKSDLIPGYMTAEEFGQLWQDELARFKKVFGNQ